MHIFPTDEEIEIAAKLLVEHPKISAQLLGELFGKEKRDQVNDIRKLRGEKNLERIEIARFLVQQRGPTLFAGSDETIRDLRLRLLEQLPDAEIQRLFDKHPTEGNIKTTARKRTELSKKKWFSGKSWASAFVVALGFPPIFAGLPQAAKVPTIQDIPPLTVPPKLADFQSDLKERMLGVLKRERDKTRCVVTLPTGGGKTRVAVEAFIEWMQPRFAEGKYLIWIAQSEELCEQAIACIEQMWGSREFVSSLRIYRFFGGRGLSLDDLYGGVMIASIQQLYKRIEGGDEALDVILKNTGAMIIDEAHRATSKMYDRLLSRAEELCSPDLFPICGLTATPGRAGMNRAIETVKLVDRFEAYLIKPDLEGYEKNPLQYFRDHRFLAQVRHILYEFGGKELTLTNEELREMKQEQDIPSLFLKRLAVDKKGNLHIIQRLLKLEQDTPTLVYTCTVDHAYFLATILTANGRKARAVSADTPMALRRALIHDFKTRKLEFLCNYGVLTTGFDAPKTECIALCRPTTSEILYEQMIGRGFRGPKFGGTEECTIIDFADNIRIHGSVLAYERFADCWTSQETEKPP